MRAEETKIEQEGERNLKQKESKSVRMIRESRHMKAGMERNRLKADEKQKAKSNNNTSSSSNNNKNLWNKLKYSQ